MKFALSLLLVAVLAFSGCAHHKAAVASRTPAAAPAAIAEPSATPAAIVTPETGVAGKVASFNDAGRFVVLNFPVGRMPAAEQRLFVYRQGLKVGEVKVDAAWKRDENVVADLLAGEARPGDEVRDN
jgi:hypothetical protein